MQTKQRKMADIFDFLHIGMLRKVLYHCENLGRQRDFAIFWHFHSWIESFFNSIEFLCIDKVNCVEARLNSVVKMSKIYKIMLSADVFATKQNLGKVTFNCIELVLIKNTWIADLCQAELVITDSSWRNDSSGTIVKSLRIPSKSACCTLKPFTP